MKLEMFEKEAPATTYKTCDNPQRYSIDKLVEDLSIKKKNY